MIVLRVVTLAPALLVSVGRKRPGRLSWVTVAGSAIDTLLIWFSVSSVYLSVCGR